MDLSNHTPLVLNTGASTHNNKQPLFIFERGWLLREGFFDMLLEEGVIILKISSMPTCLTSLHEMMDNLVGDWKQTTFLMECLAILKEIFLSLITLSHGTYVATVNLHHLYGDCLSHIVKLVHYFQYFLFPLITVNIFFIYTMCSL
ncbi:hypothetical protein ACJX0J_039956, partial [Zea mays]